MPKEYLIISKMGEENKSQELRLKNIDKTRNYIIEKKDQYELMVKKQKKDDFNLY